MTCNIRDCAAPDCDNYYVPEGQCCPVCSSGECVYCMLMHQKINGWDSVCTCVTYVYTLNQEIFANNKFHELASNLVRQKKL